MALTDEDRRRIREDELVREGVRRHVREQARRVRSPKRVILPVLLYLALALAFFLIVVVADAPGWSEHLISVMAFVSAAVLAWALFW